jgi:hypothetical protein
MVQSILKGDIVRVIEDHHSLRSGDIYEVVTVIPDGILAYSRAHDEYEGIPDGNYEVVLKRPGHRLPSISLRDWFAGQALAGMLAYTNQCRGDYHTNANYDVAAEDAYQWADAMLAQREVPNG